MPEIPKQKIAPLAMETLGGNGKPLKDKIFAAREGLSYGLTHPIMTVVSGITSVAELQGTPPSSQHSSP